MKRCILITRLSVEITGQRRYTIKIGLRGGETYLMPTRNKKIYNRLNEELSNLSETTDYDFLLQVAMAVLKFNDVFFDEVEYL